MQQFALEDVIREIAGRLASDDPKAAQGVEQMLLPALNQFPDNPALWFYTGFWSHKIGNNALAVEAWEHSYQLEPQPMVLANLGAALRETGQIERARSILKRADFMVPDQEPVLTNLSGSYVNEGEPWPGIEYGERCLKIIGKEEGQAAFNVALCHLEAGNFARGFDLYAVGHHEWRDRRSYEGATRLTRDNFEQAKGKRLLVYGEQGIGDELMFATMFHDAVDDFELVFDHHPRLGGIYETAAWYREVECHPTRKSAPTWYTPGDVDYFTAAGNLAQFYRRSREDFPEGPFYGPNSEERVATNRAYLETMADGRKIVGLAMRGGTLKTARTYRAMQPGHLEPLFQLEDVMFVGLDYDDVTQVLQWASEQFGPNKLLWYPSIAWAWDYHHLGELMAACDSVVTVCQSAAHLAAAMGLKTHVLTPSKPAWRYGVGRNEGETQDRLTDPWYWYGCKATLYRQQGKDWRPAVEAVKEAL